MSKLQVNLLGGCECRLESGEDIKFPTRKTRALFAYLVCCAGHTQSRDKLAGLFWGDFSQSRARTNLRSSLSRLRASLPKWPEKHFVSESGGVLLELQHIRVDVLDFEQHLGRQTPGSMEQLVMMYKGVFLEGFDEVTPEFQDWLVSKRNQYQEQYLQTLHWLLSHYSKTGAVDRGIQIALKLIYLDPLQESIHRNLMRLYLYQGRLGAALEQYEQCKNVLLNDLSISPSKETEKLRTDVLTELGTKKKAASQMPEVERDSYLEKPLLLPAAAEFRERNKQELTSLSSIAVLAFESESDTALAPHLANGLAEEIAIELGRFRELQVVAPASAFVLSDTSTSAEDAGIELGARYTLCGTLHVKPKSFRLAVRLLENNASQQIWAERYDCSISDVFDVQDDLVRKVVISIVDKIEKTNLDRLKRKRTEDWNAYEFWLKGWHRLKQTDLAAIQESRRLFEQAIGIDPLFARPYVGQAHAHINEWACYSWNHWFFLKQEALDLAQKAVELDDQDNRAHGMLGIAQIYNDNYREAQKCFHIALDINPNDCDVLANAACVFALIGEHDKAIEVGRRALKLSPYHPDWYIVMVGVALFSGREYQEAINVISTSPEANCTVGGVLAASHAYLGHPELGAYPRETVTRYFKNLVARGAYPSDRSCIEWLMDCDPFQKEEDRIHYKTGLELAGFK